VVGERSRTVVGESPSASLRDRESPRSIGFGFAQPDVELIISFIGRVIFHGRFHIGIVILMMRMVFM